MTRRTDIRDVSEWERYQQERRTRWASGAISTSGGVESRHAQPEICPASMPGEETCSGAPGFVRPTDGDYRLISRAGVAPGPLTLTLPFPPTVNHSTMPDGFGGRYLTPDHRAFRSAVDWIVSRRELKPLTGRLRVEIELFPADRRKWDIDNRIKAVLDALQHAGLFADDECIDQLEITRHVPGNEAWCVVSVGPTKENKT